MYVSIDVTKSGIDRGTHEVKVIINNVINIIEIIFSLVSSAGGFIARLGGGAALSLFVLPPFLMCAYHTCDNFQFFFFPPSVTGQEQSQNLGSSQL